MEIRHNVHYHQKQVVAPQHFFSPINNAFATEHQQLIKSSRIDAWIYGHSHTNIDTTIGSTRIISNQLRYVDNVEYVHNVFEQENWVEM